VLEGEVKAGGEWKAALGQGWVFRVLPIRGGKPADGNPYSGWDLVVDREQAAGFPDALLVATPPYNSISEREVGTTFGLRAQDAIGWNPRSFRFLYSPQAFAASQKLFWDMNRSAGGAGNSASARQGQPDAAAQKLMAMMQQSAAGEFKILDARLTPGIADPAPYAQNWALASSKTPHRFEANPSGKSTPRGELHWMRFSVTLWLPDSWQLPREVHATREACSE
jgi:hypothetical protein